MEGPFYEPGNNSLWILNPSKMDSFKNTGAKQQSMVAPKAELNGTKALLIEGQIRNKECKPVEGAKVSIWYAGFYFDNSGK